MSVPAYSSYRDSGVEWLGAVPSHWGLSKFRHRFRESPEKIEDEVVGPMLSVSGYRGIEVKIYDDENRRRLDEDLVGYRIVRPGQLVVNTMWLNYAGLGVSQHEGHVSPAYRSYWINAGLNGRYAHHLLRSGVYVQGYTSLLTGIRPNSLQMSRDDLMEFPVVVPPPDEQTAIAAFLDGETAKIDALVEAQRRLIELLKEKRQAVISHAVTKGLDPTAPVKDSGIEWLGDVPCHWNGTRLRFVARLNPSKFEVSDRDRSEEVSFLPMEAIGDDGSLRLGQTRALRDVESGYTYFRDCDVIVAKITPCFENGKGAIVRGLVGGVGFGTTELIVARPQAGNSPDFLHWLFNSSAFRKLGEGSMYGAGGQKRVPDDFVRDFRIATPPSVEQSAIASFLDDKTSEFAALIAEAEAAVVLLKERRTALISAAVTGNIDVRGLLATQADAA